MTLDFSFMPDGFEEEFYRRIGELPASAMCNYEPDKEIQEGETYLGPMNAFTASIWVLYEALNDYVDADVETPFIDALEEFITLILRNSISKPLKPNEHIEIRRDYILVAVSEDSDPSEERDDPPPSATAELCQNYELLKDAHRN